MQSWCGCFMVWMLVGPAWSFEIPPLTEFPPGYARTLPVPEATCGAGDPAHYVLIAPSKVTHADHFFFSFMGGAICFNKASCTADDYEDWLDLYKIVKRYAKSVKDEEYQYLISGNPVPLSLYAGLNPAYLPYDDDHALAGQYGIFIPTCTADGYVGNYLVNYTSDFRAFHDGAVLFRAILDAVKVRFPSLKRITVVGASGSAVGAQAWIGDIADAFPNADIHLLADSFAHVLPATPVYDYFWKYVQWSPNPNGNHTLAQKYSKDAQTPTFDWTKRNVIPQLLKRYNGRVKIAYIQCERDHVIKDNRRGLSAFSDFNPQTANITQELWDFLINVHQEAPAGTVYSYIQDCDEHHQTRKYKDDNGKRGWCPSVPGTISPQEFVDGFIINGSLKNSTHWCCGRKLPTETNVNAQDASDVNTQDASEAPVAAFGRMFFVVFVLAAMW